MFLRVVACHHLRIPPTTGAISSVSFAEKAEGEEVSPYVHVSRASAECFQVSLQLELHVYPSLCESTTHPTTHYRATPRRTTPSLFLTSPVTLPPITIPSPSPTLVLTPALVHAQAQKPRAKDRRLNP